MKADMTDAVLEFSRRVPVRELPDGGRDYRFEATADERAAVARRLDIIAVEELTAHFTLTPEGRGAVARGGFEAVVVQQCVLTLEPVTNRVKGEMVQRFAPDCGQPESREIELEALAEDLPEPLVHGAAELGELIVEHLALALDPYPRRPGADAQLPREGGGKVDTPFAKLRGLKHSATEG